MSIAPLVAAATDPQQLPTYAINSRGVSALLYSCQQGDVDKVRRILRAHPKALLERDRTRKTALHYCCTSDSILAAQAADVLVMAAPDLVESRDEDGFTPLHLAVIAGNMPLVTFLLANNADINAVDNEKHTVVHWATVCGETGALQAVLTAGAPVSTPDVHGGYPLHYAAQMCGGEKDSALGLQVLHSLLAHEAIKVSVEDSDGRQPVLWAASAGSAKAVLALIRSGAAVETHDKDGLTALHCAASRGHTDCIDTLLTLCGASPDVIDSNGCTALHYAVTLGHADATALLLAHGADPNRQDRKGRSPAHCGCAKGQIETVKMIGGHDGNLWLKNAKGDLPLHEAASSGRRDLVRWLLEARPSNVNARNNDGRCPLHLAALNDNSDMCKILLDTGAQVNPILRTSKNVFMTPLDCALQRGFRSTAKYLQLHGGVPASKLASVTQGPTVSSAVSLQIRDDVTFWGDTSSGNERENQDQRKTKKRSYKRKVAYKYGKKKEPASVTDYESGKDKLESDQALDEHIKAAFEDQTLGLTQTTNLHANNLPQSEILIYANEVNIHDKHSGMRVHQNGEIVIGDNHIAKEIEIVTETTTTSKKSPDSANDRQEKRPKSAKYGKPRSKSGRQSGKNSSARKKTHIDTPDPRRKLQDEQESPREEEMPQIIVDNQTQAKGDGSRIQDKQNEIEAIVVEKTATQENSVAKPTSKPENLIHLDQQSLVSNTSNEEADERKELIVEASVHPPPKDSIQKLIAPEISVESATPRSGMSASDERQLDDHGAKPVEDVLTKVATPEQEQEIAEETKQVEEQVVKTEDSDTITTPTEDTIKLAEGAAPSIEQSAKVNESFKEPLGKISEESSEKPSEASEVIPVIAGDIVANKVIEQASPAPVDTVIASGVDKDDTSAQKVDPILVTPGEGSSLLAQTAEKELIPSIEAEGQSHELHNGTEGKSITANEISSKEILTNENQQTSAVESVSARALQDGTETEAVEKTMNNIAATETAGRASVLKNTEQNKDDRRQHDVRHKKESKKLKRRKKSQEKTEDTKQTKESELKRQDYQQFIKSSRKKKRAPPPAVTAQQDSSIDAKSSEETDDEPTPSSSSPSTISSMTKKEHRSFKILDEGEGNNEKDKRKPQTRKSVRQRSPPKKERSRSEETKPEPSKDHERLIRRSKIPTPVQQNLKSSLSKSDRHLDRRDKKEASLEARIPSLPNIHHAHKESRFIKHPRSISNMSAPLGPSYSEEHETASDMEEQISSAARKKRLRKRSKNRGTKSAGSDYESSNLIDSGFEPSPRSSRIPKWRNMSERGVNMTSVTQTIQTNIRRYHLERKIFQHLLDLKRLQIRSGQHNEAMLVKRAIDTYHRSCAATVGAGRYLSQDFSFRSFEKFLYDSLRKIQKNGSEHLQGLPEPPKNPLFCTQSTHRCDHATHAYTGVPCAAYIPKMDHHSMPKIGFDCKPQGFLPKINAKNAVTLELCHGSDKQVISLPAERLDQNKRYYVTFTVKGQQNSSMSNEEPCDNETSHRHSKSV